MYCAVVVRSPISLECLKQHINMDRGLLIFVPFILFSCRNDQKIKWFMFWNCKIILEFKVKYWSGSHRTILVKRMKSLDKLFCWSFKFYSCASADDNTKRCGYKVTVWVVEINWWIYVKLVKRQSKLFVFFSRKYLTFCM